MISTITFECENFDKIGDIQVKLLVIGVVVANCFTT